MPPVHYGGIERIVDMLALGLRDRGHAVTLFAHRDSTCQVKRVRWPGFSSHSRPDTVRNGATLAIHVSKGTFDIVHSFSRIAYLAPILPFPIPKLMSYQREISPRTTKAAFRLSRGTLEFSAISRQMIECALPGKWHLVPNGVRLEAYTFRSQIADDAPLVFLGRLEEIKGPHIAIEVARMADQKLIIAGNIPSEHQAWFETVVAPHIDGNRVRYIGPVNDGQKDDLLGNARALLMPVLWEEPFGIVMAEAMACGTPVIGFRRGAVPEVVEHGVTGFVGATTPDLVSAVGALSAIDRTACRVRVEKFYCDRAIVESYLSIYADMLSQKACRIAS